MLEMPKCMEQTGQTLGWSVFLSELGVKRASYGWEQEESYSWKGLRRESYR